MRFRGLFMFAIVLVIALHGQSLAVRTEPLIVDHTSTDVTQIPEWAIVQAKSALHIAYGHTSHGSQITTGMSGLVAFANGGGKGLSLPKDVFAWNNGGSGDALDLHDYAMEGDVGLYPQWVDRTREYLDDSENTDVNVIMWSWCGEACYKYQDGKLFSEYLTPMSQLEEEYPGVTFVYMTGPVFHRASLEANVRAANQIIRDYCEANNKVLYDFADIESHDPDGNYYAYPDDSCAYYAWRAGALLGNWAQEWQDSHVLGVDWYQCDSAHSEPLNANQKAYAAWWLFARLGGWSGPGPQANGADLDGNGKVNLVDLAVFSQDWLEHN